MVYKPRTVDEVYTSIRDRLINKISGLSNFTETSFNYVFSRSYSNRFRDNEVALLAVQLSGWVDYAGGPIGQSDLDQLGVDSVTPEEVNEFLEDEDLDRIGSLVGVDRDPGKKATGQVTFTTSSSSTTIPEGTSVGTQPDADGNFFEFTTDSKVSTASGDTTVTANITAVEVGDEYNVGAGTITYLPDPPSGVQGVTNNDATGGGADRESNDDLRARIKNAIFDKSGGGTAAGVEGYVRSQTDGVTAVAVEEYPGGNASTGSDYEGPGGPGGSSSDTPFADVIVEGGTDSDAKDSIEESRPVAIQHNLVRPTIIKVAVNVTVSGSNVQTSGTKTSIEEYVDGLDLGETVVRDKIIQLIMNSDSDIDGITSLDIKVEDESITYSSGTSIYSLRKGVEMQDDGITEVTGILSGSSTTFTEGTDYEETDDDNDGSDDAIDWGIGGDHPDDSTEFDVTYLVKDDIPIDSYEKTNAGSITVTVA